MAAITSPLCVSNTTFKGSNTHIYIQTHRCVSVSRTHFYNQFGPEGGVGWCSSQQSKSRSDCCSYSASRAINFPSLTTGELSVVKDMRWAQDQGLWDCFPIFPLSGAHFVIHISAQISALTSRPASALEKTLRELSDPQIVWNFFFLFMSTFSSWENVHFSKV